MAAVSSNRTPVLSKSRARWLVGITLATMAATTVAAVLPHDKIKGYGANLGPIHATFQPYLRVSSGCVPFPAVDAAGNVSGGLQDTGAEDGHCSSSPGQVYVRSAEYGGLCAIMYAWYFPKDQNVNGGGSLGHRHDWEDIVVWLDRCATNGQIRKISYSHHGNYEKHTDIQANNTHPRVNYGQHGGLMDHDVSPTDKTGGQQPGVAWTTLSPAARNTLNTYDFGKAVVPFKDSNFTKSLSAAF